MPTKMAQKHSYNNFTFPVFRTLWENKGNPGRAARKGLDQAISFSIWAEKHLPKKTKASMPCLLGFLQDLSLKSRADAGHRLVRGL